MTEKFSKVGRPFQPHEKKEAAEGDYQHVLPETVYSALVLAEATRPVTWTIANKARTNVHL